MLFLRRRPLATGTRQEGNRTTSWPLPCLACRLLVVLNEDGRQKMGSNKMKRSVNCLPFAFGFGNILRHCKILSTLLAGRDASVGRILSRRVETFSSTVGRIIV